MNYKIGKERQCKVRVIEVEHFIFQEGLYSQDMKCCKASNITRLKSGIYFQPKRGKGRLSRAWVGSITFFFIDNFWEGEGFYRPSLTESDSKPRLTLTKGDSLGLPSPFGRDSLGLPSLSVRDSLEKLSLLVKNRNWSGNTL